MCERFVWNFLFSPSPCFVFIPLCYSTSSMPISVEQKEAVITVLFSPWITRWGEIHIPPQKKRHKRGRACFNRSKMHVSQNCCLWMGFGSRLRAIPNKTFSWTWCKSCDSSEAPSVAADHHKLLWSHMHVLSVPFWLLRICLCSSAKRFDGNDAHFSNCHFYPHLHWICWFFFFFDAVFAWELSNMIACT